MENIPGINYFVLRKLNRREYVCLKACLLLITFICVWHACTGFHFYFILCFMLEVWMSPYSWVNFISAYQIYSSVGWYLDLIVLFWFFVTFQFLLLFVWGSGSQRTPGWSQFSPSTVQSQGSNSDGHACWQAPPASDPSHQPLPWYSFSDPLRGK